MIRELEEYYRAVGMHVGESEKRRWTLDEIDILRTYWHIERAEAFAKAFKRTKLAIYRKAFHLGLHKQERWLEDELELLHRGCPVPSRTRSAAALRRYRERRHHAERRR